MPKESRITQTKENVSRIKGDYKVGRVRNFLSNGNVRYLIIYSFRMNTKYSELV